jgi:hypothetical protein
MPPNISERHRTSLSVETTENGTLFNCKWRKPPNILTKQHLKHIHVLERRPRHAILQKIAGLELFPIRRIQNRQKVRKQVRNLFPSHFLEFLRRSRKNESWHKLTTKNVDQFVKITTRRLFPTSILIAQLLKCGLALQALEENQHPIVQIQLPKALVTLATLWSLFLDNLSEDIKTINTKAEHDDAMRKTKKL